MADVMEEFAKQSPLIKCNSRDSSSTSVTSFTSDHLNTSASSMESPEPQFLLSAALGAELSSHINEFLIVNGFYNIIFEIAASKTCS